MCRVHGLHPGHAFRLSWRVGTKRSKDFGDFGTSRREGEIDRFQWFCPKCDELLHEVKAVVDDYKNDPVSKAYQQFFDSEDARTCKKCGNVMPKP